MNMLYERLKEKGALMLIPSSAVESMGMGGLMGVAGLALIVFCAIVAWQYTLITTAVLAGAVGGAIGAALLVRYCRGGLPGARPR